MNRVFVDSENLQAIDYTENPLAKGDYENCRFINCTFSNSDLSMINFIECEFENCDLSMAKVNNTAFKEVLFDGCKLLGIRFDSCNSFLLSLEFRSCHLNLASFYKLKLKGTVFRSCSLQEVDFMEADLSNAVFDDCDLLNASFENTNLEKADLRAASGYILDPELNHIKGAKFSVPAVVGLLSKYDIKIDL